MFKFGYPYRRTRKDQESSEFNDRRLREMDIDPDSVRRNDRTSLSSFIRCGRPGTSSCVGGSGRGAHETIVSYSQNGNHQRGVHIVEKVHRTH